MLNVGCISSSLDMLGARLESEGDAALSNDACLCYISSGNVERLVECWVKNHETSSPLALQVQALRCWFDSSLGLNCSHFPVRVPGFQQTVETCLYSSRYLLLAWIMGLLQKEACTLNHSGFVCLHGMQIQPWTGVTAYLPLLHTDDISELPFSQGSLRYTFFFFTGSSLGYICCCACHI